MNTTNDTAAPTVHELYEQRHEFAGPSAGRRVDTLALPREATILNVTIEPTGALVGEQGTATVTLLDPSGESMLRCELGEQCGAAFEIDADLEGRWTLVYDGAGDGGVEVVASYTIDGSISREPRLSVYNRGRTIETAGDLPADGFVVPPAYGLLEVTFLTSSPLGALPVGSGEIEVIDPEGDVALTCDLTLEIACGDDIIVTEPGLWTVRYSTGGAQVEASLVAR